MVWGVCRRLLGHVHDAEDAFQATFLVLVRKATAVVPRAMVGNWLYGVAYRTAMKARATSIKRRAKEKQVEFMPETPAAQQDLQRELIALLDQQLDRLPKKYRAAIILCDLQGKTHKEAAQQLGWPVGTFSTRLVRGRALLAKRLRHYRPAMSAGALAMVLSQAHHASAAVPTSVVYSTIKAATLIAAGKATAGVISANVAALTEGVLKMMFLSKLKMTTAVLLIVALTVVGVARLTAMGAGENQTAREVKTGVEKPVAKAQKEDAAK
jgi:RNA polymerase sigma factor (sigma-70 family)